jgi:hypothetical protein
MGLGGRIRVFWLYAQRLKKQISFGKDKQRSYAGCGV